MAHETKTPLSLINNYLDKYIKTRSEEDLEVIKQNIDKLNRDMVNFLDSEKLEKGLEIYNHEQICDFSALLTEKSKLFKVMANQKGLGYAAKVRENLYIKADPSALERIVNNLIENAIKYTPVGGTIEIELSNEEEEIVFIVKDDGPGIPLEQQEIIFEAYYQLTHEKQNIQGIGMGLNIVKKITEEIKGSIQLESAANKGSVFKVILPMHILTKKDTVVETTIKKPSEAVSMAEKKVEDSAYDKTKHTLLVVEDNVDMLAYLRDELSVQNNVYVAKNGLEALEKIKSMPIPDVILSDIMMDGMDGYEFFRQLSKDDNFNYIPFLFLTAKSSKADKVEGLSEGAIDYISKPFVLEELLLKVKAIIQNKQKVEKTSLRKALRAIAEELEKKDYKYDDKWAKFEQKCREFNVTSREKEVIKLIADGKSYKEIGNQLNISERTVVRHVQNVYEKTGVNSKVDVLNMLF